MKWKKLKHIKSIKIIFCLSLLNLVHCQLENRYIEGLIIAKLDILEGEVSLYGVEYYTMIDGNMYPFIGNVNGNIIFNKVYKNDFCNKSPLEYEAKDSVYNINLTNSLNLNKKSDYLYSIGNNNIYSFKENLLVVFSAKMKVNIYNVECSKEEEAIKYYFKKNQEKIYVLDSLISIDNIKTDEMLSIGFKKKPIKSIDVFLHVEDQIPR